MACSTASRPVPRELPAMGTSVTRRTSRCLQIKNRWHSRVVARSGSRRSRRRRSGRSRVSPQSQQAVLCFLRTVNGSHSPRPAVEVAVMGRSCPSTAIACVSSATAMALSRRCSRAADGYRLGFRRRYHLDSGRRDPGSIQFTADGSLLWTESSTNGKQREIKVASMGGQPRTLWKDYDERWFSPTGRDSKVLVSPDGKSVAFISDRSGWIHIYVMPVNATSETQAKQITSGNFLAGLGNWSADSKKIAYHHSLAGNQMERSSMSSMSPQARRNPSSPSTV